MLSQAQSAALWILHVPLRDEIAAAADLDSLCKHILTQLWQPTTTHSHHNSHPSVQLVGRVNWSHGSSSLDSVSGAHKCLPAPRGHPRNRVTTLNYHLFPRTSLGAWSIAYTSSRPPLTYTANVPEPYPPLTQIIIHPLAPPRRSYTSSREVGPLTLDTDTSPRREWRPT